MLQGQLIIINMITWNAGRVKQTFVVFSSTTLFWFTAIALFDEDSCPHTVYSHACTSNHLTMDFKHHIIWN